MYSLKNHHTFGLDAYCERFVSVSTAGELRKAVIDASPPRLIMGGGSNCIFVDNFSGTVISVEIKGIHAEATNDCYYLTVGAGENWHAFVTWCLQNGYHGLENLALIPGTVGAAPIQNIGAYGVEVERYIDAVEYYDINEDTTKTLTRAQCQFGYRDSIFKHELADSAVITHVSFCIPKDWQPIITYGELAKKLSGANGPSANTIFETVVAIRQAKLPDPEKVGNAGSFFKNPVIANALFEKLKHNYPELPGFAVDEQHTKVPAAWLIDKSGFKGQTRGGIQCHPNQALVLTNSDNGTGDELLNFAREIIETVMQRFSIKLENEVRLINSTGLIELS